jgi:putative addiction module component (TIGR02574 family)
LGADNVLEFSPMTNFDRILAEARQLLSEDEQVRLSECLLEGKADPAVEEAWMQETLRRRAEWKAGRMAAIPWDEARKRIFAEP